MSYAKKLLVLDIDNTVFNWVEYYTSCMEALLMTVSRITAVPVATLYHEAQTIFEREGSIEYPFLVQELPSILKVYDGDIERMLREAVEPGRQAFNAKATETLKPYPDVEATLATIKAQCPGLSIIALTDAPRYVAMWKLNKLGLLTSFDAVYGLPDPRIPIDHVTQKVKVDSEILVKHLQRTSFDFTGRIRVLPDDYEKPGTRGLRTVLMDFDCETHRGDVLWVGDNLRKDVGLGKTLGVHTAWARFGTIIEPEARRLLLAFSPMQNVAKNVSLLPQDEGAPAPDFTLETFSELLSVLNRCWPA